MSKQSSRRPSKDKTFHIEKSPRPTKTKTIDLKLGTREYAALEGVSLPDGSKVQIVASGKYEKGEIHFFHKEGQQFKTLSVAIESLLESEHWLLRIEAVRAGAIGAIGQAKKNLNVSQTRALCDHLFRFYNSSTICIAVAESLICRLKGERFVVESSCIKFVQSALISRHDSVAFYQAIDLLRSYGSDEGKEVLLDSLIDSLLGNEPFSEVEKVVFELLLERPTENVQRLLKNIVLKRPLRKPLVSELVVASLGTVKLSIGIGALVGAMLSTVLITMSQVDPVGLMYVFLIPFFFGFAAGIILAGVEVATALRHPKEPVVDPDVRAFAALELRNAFEIRNAEHLLLKLLREDARIGKVAALELRDAACQDTLSKLYELASVGTEWQRILAMKALHGKVTPEASALVRRSMADSRPDLNRAAAELQKTMMSRIVKDDF